MDHKDFTRRIPAAVASKLNERTLVIWHAIYEYVTSNGQTDRFDRNMRKSVEEQSGHWISDATAQRHMKRMSDCGLLQRHRIVVKYTEIGKLMGGFLFEGFLSDGPPPGSYHCYTLPGMTPVLNPKSEDDSEEKAEQAAP